MEASGGGLRSGAHRGHRIHGGDEAIQGVLDIMNAGLRYDVLQRAVHIHPTVSELIPTMLGEMESDA